LAHVTLSVESFVFISYSRADSAYVDDLLRHLDAHGIAAWADREQLASGDRWQRTIESRIDNCAAMIVIVSTASHDSDWVGREVAHAVARHRPLFPLHLSGEPILALRDLHLEEVRDGRQPSALFFERLRTVVGARSKVGPAMPAPDPAVAVPEVAGDAAELAAAARHGVPPTPSPLPTTPIPRPPVAAEPATRPARRVLTRLSVIVALAVAVLLAGVVTIAVVLADQCHGSGCSTSADDGGGSSGLDISVPDTATHQGTVTPWPYGTGVPGTIITKESNTARLRSRPSLDDDGTVLGLIPVGATVTVYCQIDGPTVDQPRSLGPNSAWDLISYQGQQGFISDALVDTGVDTDTLVSAC